MYTEVMSEDGKTHHAGRMLVHLEAKRIAHQEQVESINMWVRDQKYLNSVSIQPLTALN